MAYRPQIHSAIMLIATLSIQFPASSFANRTYPRDFLWGATLSAHSVEGLYNGGEFSDWYDFEHKTTPCLISSCDNADIAANHWLLFGQDFGLASKIGLNSLIISIPWEKIEPSPGVFSTESITHYQTVLQEMRVQGLTPVIVLHDFTHPKWFHQQGGWLSPNGPRFFLRYVQTLMKTLGNLSSAWVTFYEPVQYARKAYLEGVYPPHLKSPDGFFEAVFQMARAHRLAAQVIHNAQGTSPGARMSDGGFGGVGLVMNMQIYDPYDPTDARDINAARSISEFANWSFPSALSTGTLIMEIPGAGRTGKILKRELPSQDLPPWDTGPSVDWLGVNYFTRFRVKPNGTIASQPGRFKSEGQAADNNWQIYPQGLERILRDTAKRFSYPLVVTANGLMDQRDVLRARFIAKHLEYLTRAIFGKMQENEKTSRAIPLDIRGYFHWSLLDGFDWLSGYSSKTGLIEVNRSSPELARRIRESTNAYSNAIKRASE